MIGMLSRSSLSGGGRSHWTQHPCFMLGCREVNYLTTVMQKPSKDPEIELKLPGSQICVLLFRDTHRVLLNALTTKSDRTWCSELLLQRHIYLIYRKGVFLPLQQSACRMPLAPGVLPTPCGSWPGGCWLPVPAPPGGARRVFLALGVRSCRPGRLRLSAGHVQDVHPD